MNPDPFEKRLEELPLRSLPANWRREILAAAGREKRSFFPDWLPGRWPTTGLATAWIIILLLRLTTPPETPSSGPAISTAAFAEARREKMLLLASIENPPSDNPGTTWPFPFENRPL